MPKGDKDHSPMPMAGAGLMRFFEDETHGIKIQPRYVVISAIALMSIVIVAHVLTGA
jgi:preprotein translocase subunit Sec61beta